MVALSQLGSQVEENERRYQKGKNVMESEESLGRLRPRCNRRLISVLLPNLGDAAPHGFHQKSRRPHRFLFSFENIRTQRKSIFSANPLFQEHTKGI